MAAAHQQVFGTLNSTATPASARHSVFVHPDNMQHYPGGLVAAMALNGHSNGIPHASQIAPPFKTQRSASLPFIRPVGNGSNASAVAAAAAAAAAVAAANATGDQLVGDSGMVDMSVAGDPSAMMSGTPTSLQHPPTNGMTNAQAAAAAAAAVAQAGLGISQTPPMSASLPLRHRTSSSHIRRTAPYQVAPITAVAAGSPHVNSPQMSPSPYWYVNSLRRTSRDSLNGHFHTPSSSSSLIGLNGQPVTPLGGAPPGAFMRRESDADLALAMNSVFTNGDVFGNHRLLVDAAGAPPSPLSQMTLMGTHFQQHGQMLGLQGEPKNGSSKLKTGSSVSGDFRIGSETATQSNASESGGANNDAEVSMADTSSASCSSRSITAELPLSSSSGLAIDMNIANDDMVVALFNAMSSASAAAKQASTTGQLVQQPIQQQHHGMEFNPSLALDPHAFEMQQHQR
ncbi:hypothetical protein FBU59_004852, partial [Linderina macrospora]